MIVYQSAPMSCEAHFDNPLRTLFVVDILATIQLLHLKSNCCRIFCHNEIIVGARTLDAHRKNSNGGLWEIFKHQNSSNLRLTNIPSYELVSDDSLEHFGMIALSQQRLS